MDIGFRSVCELPWLSEEILAAVECLCLIDLLDLFIEIFYFLHTKMFVSWLRRLVADLWHRKPRSVHLGLVDKVSLGQVFFIGRVLPLTSDIITPLFHTHLPPTLYYVFLPALRFIPVSIIQPLLHIHSFIHSFTTDIMFWAVANIVKSLNLNCDTRLQ
jgi:hypothetical protein